MPADDETQRRAHKQHLSHDADAHPAGSGDRRPRKRWGSSVPAAAVSAAVVAGVVSFGAWHDRQDEATAREGLRAEVVAQCDAMYELLLSDRPLEDQARVLRTMGVGGTLLLGAQGPADEERHAALRAECREVVERSQDVVDRQSRIDELRALPDAAPDEVEAAPSEAVGTVRDEADRMAHVYGYTLPGSAPGEGAELAELTCERAAEGWDYETAVADDIGVGAPRPAAVGWNTFVYEEFCPATS